MSKTNKFSGEFYTLFCSAMASAYAVGRMYGLHAAGLDNLKSRNLAEANDKIETAHQQMMGLLADETWMIHTLGPILIEMLYSDGEGAQTEMSLKIDALFRDRMAKVDTKIAKAMIDKALADEAAVKNPTPEKVEDKKKFDLN